MKPLADLTRDELAQRLTNRANPTPMAEGEFFALRDECVRRMLALEQSLHEAKQHLADDAEIIAQLRAQLEAARKHALPAPAGVGS